MEEKIWHLVRSYASYAFIDNAGFITRDAGVSLTRVRFSRYQLACDSNHGNSLVGLSPRRHVMYLRVQRLVTEDDCSLSDGTD